MQGRRIWDANPQWQPGDYGMMFGQWYACTPSNLLASLLNHEVVEHEDHTITVSPSILVTARTRSWHGYLERGIWREA